MTSMCSSAPSTLLKGSKHMAFNISGHGPASGRGRHQAQAEINMVPLIDVMLVLLIVFMVTAPLMTHAVKLQLPRQSTQKNAAQPETITLSVQANGDVHWNREAIAWADLPTRLTQAKQQSESLADQPEVHIRADEQVPYRAVAQLMAEVSKSGLNRIGFLTEPVR